VCHRQLDNSVGFLPLIFPLSCCLLEAPSSSLPLSSCPLSSALSSSSRLSFQPPSLLSSSLLLTTFLPSFHSFLLSSSLNHMQQSYPLCPCPTYVQTLDPHSILLPPPFLHHSNANCHRHTYSNIHTPIHTLEIFTGREVVHEPNLQSSYHALST
jgi:hypothetical protein